MKANARIGLAAAAAAVLSPGVTERALAQEPTPKLHSYVTVANGYWRRGLAQNDGPTVQLGLDYGHYSGWFAGVQAANVDYEAEQGRYGARDVELALYGGYHGGARQWSWTATLARYAYPGAASDYEYSELGAGVGFRDRVFYNATYSRGLVSGFATLNHELSVAWPVAGGVEIGAAVGRFDFERIRADFTHWNVGASKIWRRLVVDLRYHDNDYARATSIGDDVGNVFVLSVTYALRRR